MKQEAINIINKLLNTDNQVKKMLESKEFYFQKAVDKFNEFMSYDKVTNEKINKIINLVNKQFSFNYFLYSLTAYENEYKLIKILGELISYVDSKAANGKEYNQYEDKRTISSPFVRQNYWVSYLLKYKVNKEIDALPENIKNTLIYLINPIENINIVSSTHKKLISLLLFGKEEAEYFGIQVIEEFKPLNIKPVNIMNLNCIYSSLIYYKEIRELWDKEKTIWKISHGNNGEFVEGEKEEYVKEKMVVVHKDTRKKQGEDFVETMRIGDLFYLCYASSEIKLLGIITSDAMALDPNEDDGWRYRKYAIIKESNNQDRYEGAVKGWSPNYNSTCKKVKSEELSLFQKELLQPYFDMTLEELYDAEDIEEEVIEPIEEENIAETSSTYGEYERNHDELNYILYGPPGTGKTYNTVNYSVGIIENEDFDVITAEDYEVVKDRYDRYINSGQIVFTTFHQSYGYEDFIEGIKPVLSSDSSNKDLSYIIEDGTFKDICLKASKNKSKNFVMVIDEINRGNISKIFGELITLIENSKRLGNSEEMRAKLPYSKMNFGVPNNLYIIGTMNTADRSIALMDTALRRRFKFLEFQPDTTIFKKANNNEALIVEEINIKAMIDMINKRIEVLFDREHTIGQAYFMDLIKNNSIDTLKDIFRNKVIPLLQEYFYDDYEKIRLILGDNQVKETSLQFIEVVKADKNLFGKSFDYEYMEEKIIYKINKEALTNPKAYVKIYDLNSIAVEPEE
jgi:DNA replication protein DnaC